MVLTDVVDPTTAPNLWSLIVNGSALAVFAGAFFSGKLRTEAEVKRLEAQLEVRDRMIEAERAEYRRIIEAKDGALSTLNAAMADKVIPVVSQVLPVLQQLAYRSGGG